MSEEVETDCKSTDKTIKIGLIFVAVVAVSCPCFLAFRMVMRVPEGVGDSALIFMLDNETSHWRRNGETYIEETTIEETVGEDGWHWFEGWMRFKPIVENCQINKRGWQWYRFRVVVAPDGDGWKVEHELTQTLRVPREYLAGNRPEDAKLLPYCP